MVYTGGDEPFDWDDANVEHIARHGITPDEAEEALLDGGRFSYRGDSSDERRRVTIGRTDAGRYLAVVHTQRGERIRPITAREASIWERRQYQRRNPHR